MNSIREDLENIINKTYLYARGAKKDYSCTEAVKELEAYINKVREEAVRDYIEDLYFWECGKSMDRKGSTIRARDFLQSIKEEK